MSRTSYHFVDNRQPHFLTCTAVAWLSIFTRPEAVQIVLDSWQFLQNENRMTLLGYVILENHICAPALPYSSLYRSLIARAAGEAGASR